MKACAGLAFDSLQGEVCAMQRATLIASAAVIVSASMPGSLSAQSSDIFCRPIECGSFRKLTDAERVRLQDPLFRLLLANHAAERELAKIEQHIMGPTGTRRVFVVFEEIQSVKRPAQRRSVIDFRGQNGGIQLDSNVFLSVFFDSNAFPQVTDIEALAWDEANGVYNYYKLDGEQAPQGQKTWKLAATSRNADTLTPQQRSGTCLGCHANGVPVMKELLFPWNNWHSFKSSVAYLTIPDLKTSAGRCGTTPTCRI